MRIIRDAMLASLLSASSALAWAATPATLRVDIQHSGDAKREAFALERVLVEPLPWAGNPARPLDGSNRGTNRFDVVDEKSGQRLYSRGYSTVFGEWRTTEEAGQLARSFQESLRMPMPAAPVLLKVYGRDAANAFVEQWSVRIDPQALDVERVSSPAPATPIKVHYSGDPATKVDLLILGDGYTRAELPKFEAQARRMAQHLFTVSPFKERAQDFNVWALTVPVPESGISRPSTGVHHATALGTRYDIFGSERYALTLDNREWRELAQYAPYEVVEIMFNNETYGGGGIFGQFSTAAADNDWVDYLFVHEFGHHFADLADEYYTSPTSYAPVVGAKRRALAAERDRAARSRQVKWKSRLTPGVADADAVAEGGVRGDGARDPGAAQAAARRQAPRVGNDRTVQGRVAARARDHGPLAGRAPRSALSRARTTRHRATTGRRCMHDVRPRTATSAACASDAIEEIIDLYSR